MSNLAGKLRRMSDEDLHDLTASLDAELDRRDRRRSLRGFERSTYGLRIPRQKRKAPRAPADDNRRRIAA